YRRDGGSYTAHKALDRGLLIRHCHGKITIGVHSTSTDGRCKWFAGDIDAHDDTADADANWRAALTVATALREFGLKPLIFDSNGRGGFHVWAFFQKPLAVAVAHWLGARVNAALEAAGFPTVETFPKQGELTPDTPYGNWIRLPGRHHKRE